MLHYDAPLPDIDLSIKNREKQLCKPILRLFQNSDCRKEISQTLVKLLADKRERKYNTLEAKLYRIVRRLVSDYGLALENSLIWTTVKEELNGEDISGKSQSCYTVEHGQVSLRQVIGLFVDKFGAAKKHDGKNRLLVFSEDKLQRLKSIYEIAASIEIIPNGTNTSNGSEDIQQVLESIDDADNDASIQDIGWKHTVKDGNHNTKPENVHPKDPVHRDAFEEPLKSLESLGDVQCPYDGCTRSFGKPQEVIDHSILTHGNFPVTSKLAERGYEV